MPRKSTPILSSRQVALRLRRAREKPRQVVDDLACHSREMCLRLFDVWEAAAYEDPSRALEYSAAAVALARRSGDRHMLNLGRGVELNAASAIENTDWLTSLLRLHEAEAAGCCARCLADFLHRRLDYEVDFRHVTDAFEQLPRSDRKLLAESPPFPGAPPSALRARLWNLRGMARFFGGDHAHAMTAAASALRSLGPDSPELFYRDAIGLVGCFLRGADPAVDEHALRIVRGFAGRLAKLGPGPRLRRLHRWVTAKTRIRLGKTQDGFEQLERVRYALLDAVEKQEARRLREYREQKKEGKEKAPAPLSSEEERENLEGVAITADTGQYLCRGTPSSLAVKSATQRLGTCIDKLTLEPKLKRFLEAQHEELQRFPEKAGEIFAAIRASVLVPIPDLFTERFLGPEILERFRPLKYRYL